ncbi:ubiquitin-conjugating enzyme E2 D4-like [Lineus longissimus]|uniref:ubiquitin-conjugating enzyme E2 D4-like n=1 Tax=Lineus longissimus TaxID=88925 RepID=UPI002B4D5BC0
MLKRQLNVRLQKELAAIQRKPPCGGEVKVTLPGDSLNEWQLLINGPLQSLYKGGKFKVSVFIPEDYPYSPPKVLFLTPIYHLNVSEGGQMCIRFLAEESWKATNSMEQLISAIFALLITPQVESSVDHDRLNKYQNFRRTYDDLAKGSAEKAK